MIQRLYLMLSLLSIALDRSVGSKPACWSEWCVLFANLLKNLLAGRLQKSDKTDSAVSCGVACSSARRQSHDAGDTAPQQVVGWRANRAFCIDIKMYESGLSWLIVVFVSFILKRRGTHSHNIHSVHLSYCASYPCLMSYLYHSP